ncbi:GNAT family N-acetyltransferase [Micromonospora sp. BQ11]|uniref:GNAT family N-acetyltransferase n=1 Tax=Micromonospora sp. BQ11 TaxID=3452212 RepID=UPI003F892F85
MAALFADEVVTARLSLRRPTPADVARIHALHTDRRACAHNPSDLLTDVAGAEDRYRAWDAHWRAYGFGYWAMRPRHDPEQAAVGFCGLKVVRWNTGEVLNLFYRLDPAVWGDGLATEAAAAVVSWAGRTVPGRPVVARVRPANVASARVAVRAGLRRAPDLDRWGEDGLDEVFTSR